MLVFLLDPDNPNSFHYKLSNEKLDIVFQAATLSSWDVRLRLISLMDKSLLHVLFVMVLIFDAASLVLRFLDGAFSSSHLAPAILLISQTVGELVFKGKVGLLDYTLYIILWTGRFFLLKSLQVTSAILWVQFGCYVALSVLVVIAKVLKSWKVEYLIDACLTLILEILFIVRLL